MAKTYDREHSVHYLSAVTVVTVVVAALAWFGQNRTLALAAAALGLYALHLLSIRFLLENQRRQRQVLDAQWEVLQRFLGDGPDPSAASDPSSVPTAELELVPPMPVDREDPETLVRPAAVEARRPALDRAELVPPIESMNEPEAHPGASLDELLEATPEDLRDLAQESSGLPAAQRPDAYRPAAPPPRGASRSTASSRRNGAGEQEVPVPRHFALGTVALVRNLLSPEEVARVLLEQRRQPGKKFGILAVEMGLLTETEREALLLAQQEGLFTDAEMREARQRLREFRESAAHSVASLE